ncbi:unnamed protein product [Moneuplotes crassus]|uniref:TLC domain-containing protein n=1 Tax=Euplotes crassus TaxID=5936 RepID=A0AAD1ULS6_EUPCR|nr:unnamed protein product [Moneuplotes crassus]
MIFEAASIIVFFMTSVGIVKRFYTPPRKKEDDRLVELDKEEMMYQYHDCVSVVYSCVLVLLYSTNYLFYGIDFERKGTELEYNIILFGTIWYIFDCVLKHHDEVYSIFVWIHHTFMIASMLVCLQIERSYCFGATVLFLNDCIYILLVTYKTFERINLPFDHYKYKICLISLTIALVASRIFGNFWLISRLVMTSDPSILLIMANFPVVCFGIMICIQLACKLFMLIPYWCSNRTILRGKAFWRNVKSAYLKYKSWETLYKFVDISAYFLSALAPIGIVLYSNYSEELF